MLRFEYVTYFLIAIEKIKKFGSNFYGLGSNEN